MLASEWYLELLAENPVIGVGLIHPDSGVLNTDTDKAYFSELGCIQFLFHFGLAGLAWVVYFAYVFNRNVRKVLLDPTIPKRSLMFLIGGHAYFIGSLLMAFLNMGFVMYGGIVLIVLFVAYSEVLSWKDRTIIALRPA